MGPEVALAAPAGNCVNIAFDQPCLYPILTTTNTGTTVPVASTYTDAFTTDPPTGTNASYGTSFSAPLVSGVAALVLAVQPALTPDEVRGVLRASARAFPQSGVIDTPAVQRCPAPLAGVDRPDQCYCTTSTCGAGMLDAAFAVDVAHLQPRIGLSTDAPRARKTLVLDADGTLTAGGRSVVAVQWSLLDGGGIVSALTPGDAGTASARPSGAGTFVVELRVTDDTGLEVSATRTIGVASSGGSGGGALQWGWLAALAAAGLLLPRRRRA
jgi:serine protease